MKPQRGEVWIADLNPTQGSEQAGIRPVLVLQNPIVNRFTKTVIAIPLTTNLLRAKLPTSVQISQGEGGLTADSVALCHQIRVLDETRFLRKLGSVNQQIITIIEDRVTFALGLP